MKKLILLFVLVMINTSIFAPARKCIVIPTFPPDNYYDKLIKAIYQVETNNGTYLYNPEEEATGPLQIRPIRLNDYNKRTGKNYTLDQMYNFNIAREIFLYYTVGRPFEIVAKSWNGSGYKTIEYWKKVKKFL